MSGFSPIKTWEIPESAFLSSINEMATDGREGNEGIALWLGKRQRGIAKITSVVALRGDGIIKEPDRIVIQSGLLNDVADLAIELNLSLIGQMHSHGPGYSVNLSPTDRAYGIAVPYYLSIVCPDYALRQNTRITECGVHVFESKEGFRSISQTETEQRIKITGNVETKLLVVGDV